MFFTSIGVKDSNEAKILAILEASRIYARSFQEFLIVESDLINAISWATGVVMVHESTIVISMKSFVHHVEGGILVCSLVSK